MVGIMMEANTHPSSYNSALAQALARVPKSIGNTSGDDVPAAAL